MISTGLAERVNMYRLACSLNQRFCDAASSNARVAPIGSPLIFRLPRFSTGFDSVAGNVIYPSARISRFVRVGEDDHTDQNDCIVEK